MSGITLSRERGFIFGDLVVDNSDGVYLMRVEKPSTPTLDTFQISAPMRDGDDHIDNRYLNKDILVVIGVYKENIQERRNIQRDITNKIVGKYGRLYFKDDPNRFHLGKVYEAVEVSETEFFTELEFKFVCKPFIYEDTSTEYEWPNIMSSMSQTITNNGTHIAKPVIKISGVATRINITIGDTSFTLANVNDTTYVDSENMIVYRYVGGRKESLLPSFSGMFPIIKIGASNLNISGEGLNVNVNINFLNTYIC